jgi:hypothetical protein
VTRGGLSTCVVLALAGCSRPTAPTIHLEVGPGEAERLDFAPESSFAEYVELPGLRHELRLSFAGYGASCDGYVTPPPGRPLVSVIVTSPWPEPLRAGRYAWSGESERAHALPSVRIGPRSYPLPAGGGLTLRSLELVPHGSVEGDLGFESPADAERSAKSVRGRFTARLCRVNRAAEAQ